MTLKVEKVLHHEKSKYQDVLIFQSTDYGKVLVLDNVIQCTERDEFSYQEMITHLAMNSHPNPKKVLVIGGGDGGVLREVVKHDCVEEAILCDIDEAVIRLSKEYLPNMSAGFNHPKVKVHVGDGFKFLADYQNTFDVIITDSSDPEGPAESLFQKPYFQLLFNALTEGGVITTQGCMFPYESRRGAQMPAFSPPFSPISSPARALEKSAKGRKKKRNKKPTIKTDFFEAFPDNDKWTTTGFSLPNGICFYSTERATTTRMRYRACLFSFLWSSGRFSPAVLAWFAIAATATSFFSIPTQDTPSLRSTLETFVQTFCF